MYIKEIGNNFMLSFALDLSVSKKYLFSAEKILIILFQSVIIYWKVIFSALIYSVSFLSNLHFIPELETRHF